MEVLRLLSMPTTIRISSTAAIRSITHVGMARVGKKLLLAKTKVMPRLSSSILRRFRIFRATNTFSKVRMVRLVYVTFIGMVRSGNTTISIPATTKPILIVLRYNSIARDIPIYRITDTNTRIVRLSNMLITTPTST